MLAHISENHQAEENHSQKQGSAATLGISYISIAINDHGQGNLQKEEFIEAYSSREIKVQHHHAGEA